MRDILHCEEFGDVKKPTITFLHGLLGSSRNWRGVARELSQNFNIFALDLRNHGSSFHSKNSSIFDMVGDLLHWMDHRNQKEMTLCGHSLGGKVAMKFACEYSHRIKRLVVADIAPRNYPPEHHIPTLDALLNIDLNSIDSRKMADEVLAARVPNWAFRQFLLTNLIQSNGIFHWKPNLSVLRESIADLSVSPLQSDESFAGPSLFVRGGKSGYLRSEHFSDIVEHFPAAKMEVLPEAGHDVHVEDRKGFLRVFTEFLNST